MSGIFLNKLKMFIVELEDVAKTAAFS